MIGSKESGWRPTKCRAGCAYAGKEHHGINECRYQELTGSSRGCDPGKGCTRYRKLAPGEARLRSPDELTGLMLERQGGRRRKSAWDVRRGYEMFREGRTSREIAEALGTTTSAVQHHRQKYWNHGRK